MITPELQNYIAQSRAKGMLDTDIRQSLLSSGWNPADLDQALSGQTPTLNSAGPATGKSYKGLIIALVIIFVGLPILGMLAFMGFGYFQLKNGNMMGYFLDKNNFNTDYQYPSENGGVSVKIADNRDDKSFCSGSQVSLPSSWPSDLPVYPNSKLTTSVNYNAMAGDGDIAGIVGYCTKDSVDAVAKYFVEQNTPWNIKTFLSSNTEGKQSILLAGSKGDLVISISISGKDGETEFQALLGSKK
ncbi:MAG: hypothetical protein WAV15_02250 [Minisyncoccia bacterium]